MNRERAEHNGYGGLNPSLSQWIDRNIKGKYARKEARKAAELARKLGKLDHKMEQHAYKLRCKAMKRARKAARYVGFNPGADNQQDHPRRIGPAAGLRRAGTSQLVAATGTWVKILAVVAVAWAVVTPHGVFGLSRIAIALGVNGALAYGIYRLIVYFSGPAASPAHAQPAAIRSWIAGRCRRPVAGI